ncbi:M-phase phosphoprotein 6 [Dissophora globulifera]|uniref:M-phase phosphoprotein 6 n=1 Tax=Dissophora globulifera TaxID=979702 RepID=A0A9P6RS13_9FUNG|nr:M-phase phosphoprotein 6 [Dissophora globulifera]
MAEVPHKKALSGKLLTMKFMQRQQERETREKLELEQVRVVTEAHWVLDKKAIDLPKPKLQVEYEPSYLQMDASERSSLGRVSFQKFNGDVEKAASKSVSDQQLDRELKRQREGEIGDDDMAEELGRGLKAKKVKSSASSTPSGDSTPKKSSKSNRRAPSSQKQANGDGESGSGRLRPFMRPKD